MADVLQLPDRGKAARELLGTRVSVALGVGTKRHRAVWYHVTLRGVEGAYLETDCGRCLDFRPFGGEAVEVERSQWHEAEEGADYCQRCAASAGMMIIGQSRKRAFAGAGPEGLQKSAKAIRTFAEVRAAREDDTRRDLFARECFGVSGAEMKRRGLVKTGRGRGARFRLGASDGSEGPSAA